MYTPVGQFSTHERISWLLGFFMISMSFIFNFSVIDILMWHTNLECKNDYLSSVGMSLSTWLQTNGTVGISYSILSIIFLFVLFEIYEKTRLTTIIENVVKGMYLALSIFLSVWTLLGFYMMATYYYKKCTFSFFNTYMWTRLSLSGVILFIWTVLCLIRVKQFFNEKIRSHFYLIHTTYSPTTTYSN
jgi:hypothetical protein